LDEVNFIKRPYIPASGGGRSPEQTKVKHPAESTAVGGGRVLTAKLPRHSKKEVLANPFAPGRSLVSEPIGGRGVVWAPGALAEDASGKWGHPGVQTPVVSHEI